MVEMDTGQWRAVCAELTSLRDANARLVEEKNQLRALINRWQGIVRVARGNIVKAESEMQRYLAKSLQSENPLDK